MKFESDYDDDHDFVKQAVDKAIEELTRIGNLIDMMWHVRGQVNQDKMSLIRVDPKSFDQILAKLHDSRSRAIERLFMYTAVDERAVAIAAREMGKVFAPNQHNIMHLLNQVSQTSGRWRMMDEARFREQMLDALVKATKKREVLEDQD